MVHRLLASHVLPPANGELRVSILVNLSALLRELGQDSVSLITAVGLRPDLFDNPENKLPFVTASQLLARCVEQTGCEHFGLLLGKRSKSTDLGLVGHLMLHSPDVGIVVHDRHDWWSLMRHDA